jgi:hypothetical protein
MEATGGVRSEATSNKRRRGEKHVLSVAEMLQQKKNQRKKRKPIHNRIPLSGFKIVERGTFKWRGSGNMGSVVGLPRLPTKSTIFAALTPDAAIQEMIDAATKATVGGSDAVTVRAIRQYWAVRAYIHGNRATTHRENFPLSSKVFGRNAMSRKRYNKLQRIWITKDTVTILAQASESLVVLPEVITIDEKHKPYSGESPYKRFVPNKDPPWGHWIMETVIKGSHTGLPFINCFPAQQDSGPGSTEFKSSQKRKQKGLPVSC